MTSVLVARFEAFGDVLLTLPLAETLHRSRAVSFLDVLTNGDYAGLLVRSPHIRRVRTADAADIESTEYDVLLDLHSRKYPMHPAHEALLARVRARTRIGYAGPSGGGRLPPRGQHEHAVEYYARSAGALIDGPIASGIVPIAARDVAAAARSLPAGAVAMAPGARFPFKRWPAHQYAKLVELLDRRGIPTVLIGHPFDADVIERVRAGTGAAVVVTEDDYRLAAVSRACGVVVANNSGMAHLAQVAGARVVCVHSHVLPVMWRPWGDGHVNLTGEPGPCSCPEFAALESPAPCGHGISPSVVADAVIGLGGATRE